MAETQHELLGEKDDGQRYSRPTRRVVRLMSLVRDHHEMNAAALAARAVMTPEFLWTQRGGARAPISQTRTRDYINFARQAGFLIEASTKDSLRVHSDVPDTGTITDLRWIAIASTRALEFLHEPLRTAADALAARNRLIDILEKLRNQRKEATISAIAEEAGVAGSRDEEVFRWALKVHIDGGNSEFAITYQPRVVLRGDRATELRPLGR